MPADGITHGQTPCEFDKPAKERIKITLADGKERTIQHMLVASFWHPDGTPMSAQQFMETHAVREVPGAF